VLILADDLGYADIGAYGNKVNRTPISIVWRANACVLPTFTPTAPIARRREPPF
jgi:hypothetical protein